MKILHTADWHLGKWLENTWRLPEQKEVLAEICEIADQEKVDAVIISGDLFDTFNPAAEAHELFYRALRQLGNNGKRAVIAIAGNHDQPDRIEAPDHLARECGIIFIGYPNTLINTRDIEGGLCITKSEEGFIELKLLGSEYPLRVITTPYANEYRLKTYLGAGNPEEEMRNILQDKWQQLAEKYCDDAGVNILAAHLFFMKKGEKLQEEPEDEKPILHIGGAQAIYTENIPALVQYAALGHLHRYQVVDTIPCPVVYSSSPLTYSFAEADQQKFVVIIEAVPAKQVTTRARPLMKGKRLLRGRFDNTDLALQWLNENQDAWVEITLVSDDFITAEERKRLNAAHPGIINIIPEIKNKNKLNLNEDGSIDLNKNMEELFKDYFRHRNGQDPNAEIMDIFREVMGEEEN